jgi:putative spermidine/putrescine transport system permease protein
MDFFSSHLRSSEWKKMLLLAPAVLFIIVFFALPLIRFFLLSFFSPHLTLTHYVRFFKTPVYVMVLLTTFKISLLVTFVCLILGYPIAYLLGEVSPGKRNLLLIFVLLPYWTSILIRTYAWITLLGSQGIINQTLMKLGILSQPIALMFNDTGVVIGMVHVLLPMMVLPLYSVIVKIDRNLIKASYTLGASPLQTFRNVFFPLSLPGVWSGCLLVFIISLGFFITPALLGGRKSMMLSMLIEQEVEYIMDWGFGATISFVLLGATLMALFVYNHFIGLGKLMPGRQ